MRLHQSGAYKVFNQDMSTMNLLFFAVAYLRDDRDSYWVLTARAASAVLTRTEDEQG